MPEKRPLPAVLPTSLVGSYPQPDWLINREKLAGRFPPRVRAKELWRVDPEYLAQAQDDATLLAIRAQEQAGLDILTDGEIRRESYSNHFATALDGVDIDNPGTALDRSGSPNPVPRIAGPIAQPKKPRIMPPPGAWDTHAHIFGPAEKFPYTLGRGYTPPDAPVENYIALLDHLGLARGVVVQGNAHGYDNRVLLDALTRFPQRLRGIAITDTRIKPETLRDWHALGMRGLRFHLFSDAGRPGTGLRPWRAVALALDRHRPRRRRPGAAESRTGGVHHRIRPGAAPGHRHRGRHRRQCARQHAP